MGKPNYQKLKKNTQEFVEYTNNHGVYNSNVQIQNRALLFIKIKN